MNREKLFSFLWACLLSFAVSFGAIGAMVTAFHMDVSLLGVALWCAGASLFCSICYSVPLGPIPLSAYGLICGFLWQHGALRISVESLLYRLSRQYHKAYDWDIIKLNYLTADDMELQLWLGLSLLGVLISMTASWAVCRKKPSAVALVPAGFVLACCLVVTDTVPGVFFLFLLFFGTVMLLLTGSVRRQDATRGNRLSTLLALPVALSLLILFIAIPANNYKGQEPTRKVVDKIFDSESVSKLLGRASEVGTSGSSVDSGSVDLKSVGVRLESHAEIMKVLTDYNDTLYLRGRALDTYDGITWSDSGTSTPDLYWPEKDQTAPGGEVLITTKYAHRMMYLPYYVSSIDISKVSRGVENTKKLTQYSYSCRIGAPKEAYLEQDFQPCDPEYIHLDKSVRKWAEPLAREITAGQDSTYGKALAIRDYVRNSATYSTNTYRMPSGSDDFVRWFLENSDTGYCVHFASAATVLLQAAGIPARYVTGYTVTAEASLLTIVRAKDAHAWAEYWLPGYGWTVLEATAFDDNPDETTPTGDITEVQTRPTEPQTQKPQDAGSTTPKPENEPAGIWEYLWVIPLLLVLCAAVLLQRYIRLMLRQKPLTTGSTNARALAHWQALAYHWRLLGATPDKDLFDLAQKAKFSQHAITEEELQQFRLALDYAREKLKDRNFFLQIYYRLILVVY